MTKWDSLFNIEEKERLKQAEIDRIKNAVGRDYQLPKVLKGKRINVFPIENPEVILQQMSYTKFFDRGWIKKIDEESRFHANVSLDKKYIYIHKDIGKKKHRAVSNDLQPQIDQITLIKRDLLSKIVIPKGKYGFTKEESLTEDQKREALKKLYEENHPIKSKIKKLWNIKQ